MRGDHLGAVDVRFNRHAQCIEAGVTRAPELWTLLKFLWYKRSQVNSLRITLMGTLPEYRGSGMDAVMIYKTLEAAIQKNYIGAECGWVLDNNEAMNRLQVLGDTKIHKIYRVYDLVI